MRSGVFRRSLLLVCFFLQIFAVSLTRGDEAAEDDVYSWERVGARALQEVNWNWRADLDGWVVRFHPGRPGLLGLTTVGECRIDIWVRRGQPAEKVAGIIVHELAHAFDYKYLTPALRATWLAVRNLPLDTPWISPVGDLSSDFLSGAGDFAESVRWMLQGPTAGFRSCLGLRLSANDRKWIAKGCRGLPPNELQKALIRRWLSTLPKTAGK